MCVLPPFFMGMLMLLNPFTRCCLIRFHLIQVALQAGEPPPRAHEGALV